MEENEGQWGGGTRGEERRDWDAWLKKDLSGESEVE